MKRIFPIFIFAAAAGAQATTWDLAADFSTTTNPNGVWHYGKLDGSGIFSANTTQGTFFGFAQGWMGDGGNGRPFVGINDTSPNSGSQVGQVVLHPDFATQAHPFADVHWVSPVTDTITITGKFFAGDSGAENEFIGVNRSYYLLFSPEVTGDNAFSYTLDVNAGDFIDFFVGPGSQGPGSGTTPLDIHIVDSAPVPEPATCAALSLGAAALLRRKKRA